MATVTISASIFQQDASQLGDNLPPTITFNKWKWVMTARAPLHKTFLQVTSAGGALTGPVVFSNVPFGSYDIEIIPVSQDGTELPQFAERTSVTVDSGNLVNRPNGSSASVS